MPISDEARHRTLARIAVALAAAAIAAATLIPVPGNAPPGDFTCLRCGAWLQDGLNNILLFVPLGLSLAASDLRRGYPSGFALLASCGIEALQVSVIDGRDAALSDVISNSLGGLLGEVVWQCRLWAPSRMAARWTCLAVGGGIAWLAGSPGRWFAPIGLPAPYYAHLDPREAPLPADATLRSAEWNGRPIICCPDPASDRMQAEAHRGFVTTSIDAVLLTKPADRGRLLALWSADGRTVAELGVTPTGVWGAMGSRTRADGGRDLFIGAAPQRPWRTGDSVAIRLEAQPGTWRLTVTQDGRTTSSTVRQRPVLVAHYLLPVGTDVAEPIAGWRWMVFLLPAVLFGWVAAFTDLSMRWAFAPLVSGIAAAWGHPWQHVGLMLTDLGMLAVTASVATVAGGQVLKRRRSDVRLLRGAGRAGLCFRRHRRTGGRDGQADAATPSQ